MKYCKILALAAVISMGAASAANASIVLHFNNGSGVTATLNLTTSGADNGHGARDVTALTGNVTGGVAPGAVTSFTPTPGLNGIILSADGRWLFDNWLYASPAQTPGNLYQHGLVDNGGLLFSVGNNEYNLFWNFNGPGGYELEVYNPVARTYTGNYFGNGAVPEPAAWTLMLVGFGGLGASLRSRRKPVYAVQPASFVQRQRPRSQNRRRFPS